MNRHALPSRRSGTAGYTLLEILVTTALLGLLGVGLFSLFLQSLNLFHFDSAKLRVNRDIRTFTSEMTDNATYANYFMIFPDFETRTQTSTVDDGDGTPVSVTVDASLNDGLSGDMLVLVYTDVDSPSKINRLVGYYRDADDEDSEGPVRTFDIAINPSSTAPIWTLLPPVNSRGNWPEVIEISKGLADGKLFYNFRDRSVMVKGQIIHRGGIGKTRYERATNTYNFTVAPRG